MDKVIANKSLQTPTTYRLLKQPAISELQQAMIGNYGIFSRSISVQHFSLVFYFHTWYGIVDFRLIAKSSLTRFQADVNVLPITNLVDTSSGQTDQNLHEHINISKMNQIVITLLNSKCLSSILTDFAVSIIELGMSTKSLVFHVGNVFTLLF